MSVASDIDGIVSSWFDVCQTRLVALPLYLEHERELTKQSRERK